MNVEPSPRLAFAVLLLALLGGLAVGTWHLGFRGLQLVAVGGTISWPWIYQTADLGDAEATMALTFIGLLVGLFEAMARFPTQTRELLLSERGKLALAVGLGHLFVGLGLQFYARRFEPLLGVSDPESFVFGLVLYALFGLALVAIGALPVVLWQRARHVSPAAVAGVWVTWGIYGAWQMRRRFPLSASAGTDWIAFRPHPDYLFQWSVALVGVLVFASVEWSVRSLRRGALAAQHHARQ